MLSVNPCLDHDDIMDILQSTGQDVSNVCNNQTYYPSAQVPLVPCAEDAVIMAQNYQGPDRFITQNEVWDQKFFSGNVTITTGNTVTATGLISFRDDSHLIVERGARHIVDGGTLTSCNNQWEGVIVEGNANAPQQTNPTGGLVSTRCGVVILQNGAVIENANNAISMNPSHRSLDQNYYGGLVIADDAIIRNCDRGVEFMRYTFDENSSFTNVVFQNMNEDGVTIWGSYRVDFVTCDFIEIVENGIEMIDAGVLVTEGCSFINVGTGIKIDATSPLPYSIIIGQPGAVPNNFTCDTYGIDVSGASSNQNLIIHNNNIIEGSSGIRINGMSNYTISYNEFSEQFSQSGVKVFNTGSQPNGILQNSFFRGHWGCITGSNKVLSHF